MSVSGFEREPQPLILTAEFAKHLARQGFDLSGFGVDRPIPTSLYVEKIAMPAFRRQFERCPA